MRLSDNAVLPLPTPETAELAWLDEAIGDARVVAIGESAHYDHESYLLRHRLLRYLVERHGFSAYAMESGFVEGWLTGSWVRGAEGDVGEVMANGLTSIMGPWTEMRAHLEWMRAHGVGFHGVDLPGSMVSLLPGIDAVLAYLAVADPGFAPDPAVRGTAAAFAAPSALSAPAAVGAYARLDDKDVLTKGLGELASRMADRRAEYVARTSADAYERVLRAATLTVALDALFRAMPDSGVREVAIADTVEWVLRREGRIVLAAHNAHVQRGPVTFPGMPPLTTAGTHLAARLGAEYLVIGMTTGSGQTLNTGPDFYTGALFTDLPSPEPGTLDALMAATHDGPFATDLRRLSQADADAVRTASRQRSGSFHYEVNALDAYDIVVHLPHVTPAEPDTAALTHAPAEVREAFARWTP